MFSIYHSGPFRALTLPERPTRLNLAKPKPMEVPFLLLRVAVAGAGIVLFAAGCGDGGDAILIGVAGPFDEPRGMSMRNAAELAAREINNRGGVRGRPIELIFRDDGADALRAVEIARSFVADPRIVAVIGHLTSGTMLATAPVYGGGARPLVAVSPSASSPLLSDAGPFIFRVCPTDLLHGSRLADWAVNRLGVRRASVLYVNDGYGRGVAAVFRDSFQQMGGVVVTDDPFLADLPGFEPYLQRIRARGGTDALMIAGTRGDAERILPMLDSLRLAVRVLGGDGLSGIEASPVPSEGTYISSAYLPDRPGERNEAFVRAYAEAFDGALPDHRGAGAYDIVYLLTNAIETAGTDRRRLRDHLAGVGTRTAAFEGVTGTIAFDENGDVPDKDIVVGVVRGNRLVTAGER